MDCNQLPWNDQFDVSYAPQYLLIMEKDKPPVLLSGIQPSGNLMIGNHIGAIANWVKLQETCDCLFPLVDLHAITVRQEPSGLLARCYEFAALYIACGIDPERSTIFIQSHVPAHCQLAWVLNCFTPVGALERMTQYKEKTEVGRKAANAGLFDYPVLMAADILLYRTNLVPVGEDQKQHLELARDLAMRFNRHYGDLFIVPEPFIPETGARIKGLQEPGAKMSKSDPEPGNYIALLDEPETVRRKIRAAVTDPRKEIRYDPEVKPGISNLITILSAVTGKTISLIETEYEGFGYSRFKSDLADALVDFLEPVQRRFREISSDPEYLNRVLARGAEAARGRSAPMLAAVHKAIGLVPARS